jgi:hypothetical protein
MLRALATLAVLCGIAVLVLCAMTATRRGDLIDHFGDCTRGAAAPPWQQIDQGWNGLEQWQFWYTSQGSQMIDYDWFLALEQPGRAAKPFAAPDHLAELGFVPAPRGRCNPDALPLGFTLDINTRQLGLSCAACHTRLIRTDGREILVDGAPADIHFNRFVRNLAEALEYTTTNTKAWSRFVQHVHGQDRPGGQAKLRTDVINATKRLREFQHFVSAGGSDDGESAGFGRVDAFGAIFNRVAVGALGTPANYRPADAPVNYPYLWGAPQLDITQWNGSAPNRVPFGPLARNLGEAIGLFGGVTLASDRDTGFSSPVKVDNLHALEALIEKLRAPAWTAAGLPPIDPALVARGHAIYEHECRQCHVTPSVGERVPPHPIYSHDCRECHVEARVINVDAVGTDPLAARNFIDRDAETGALQGQRKWLLLGDLYGARAPTRELVVTAIVGVIVAHRLGSVRPEDLLDLVRERPGAEIAGYKARPLSGIWATAPYLHNGSVPTLADLLLPPEQRPAVFRTGPGMFDPERVGLGASLAGAQTTLFDTHARGNSNDGHRYGTTLDDEDKRALLEFLKTL